ncbi:hypothetical protein P4S73_17945 [Paraglaciecola sp. Hal342]
MKLISKNKIFLMLGLALSSAQASATVIGESLRKISVPSVSLKVTQMDLGDTQ